MLILEVTQSVTDEILLNAVLGLGAILVFTGAWKFAESLMTKKDDPDQTMMSGHRMQTNDADRLRTRFAFWWVGSIWEKIQEAFAILWSVVSCVMFIVLAQQVAELTNKASDTDSNGDPVDWKATGGEEEYTDIFLLNGKNQSWLILEFCISMYFLVEYFLNFFLAAQKFHYIFSVNALIDQITVVPAINMLVTGTYFYGFAFLRFVRILKSLNYFRNIGWSALSGVVAHAIILIITILSVFFAAAGFIFVSENNTANAEGLVADFLDAIYFIVVSFTTVGYGDISPKSQLGKIVVMGMIVAGIAVVPPALDRLLTLAKENGDKGHKWYKGVDHIVVYSHVVHVIEFFREFYHEDHEQTQIKSMLMLPETNQLPREVEVKLKEPVFHYRVTDMIGAAMNDMDLARAGLSSARHVFILANRYAEKPDEEDARVILETFAIRKFHPEIPMSVQILNEKHRESVRGAHVQHVLCINELRMGMLAQAAIAPGFSTLIGNLVRSVAEGELEPPGGDGNGGKKSPVTVLPPTFHAGLGNELYMVKHMETYAGMTFDQVALIMYIKFGVMLIGTTPQPQGDDGGSIASALAGAGSGFLLLGAGENSTDSDELTLNPGGHFEIPSEIDGGVYGIVLAQDDEQIRKIEAFDKSELTKDPRLKSALKTYKANKKGNEDSRAAFLARACPYWSRGDDRAALGKPADNAVRLTGAEKRQIVGDKLAKLERGGLTSTRSLFEQEEHECQDHELELVDSKGRKVADTGAALPHIEAWTGGRHMLVMGDSVSDIVAFVEKIRAYDLKHVKPIVIMTPTGLPEMESQQLGRQSRVYQMLGRPTDMHDLERAGVYKADNAFLLGSENPQDASADAESVVAFRLCKRGTTFPMVDLAFSQNAAFLGPLASTNTEYLQNPYYAAGQMYASSCLDTLLCQTFYEPFQLRTVRRLLSGSVFSIHVEDHFDHLVGQPWWKLFIELLRFDLLCMGIYRRNHSTPLRYVVTNPDPEDVVVEEKDIVFVLNSAGRLAHKRLKTHLTKGEFKGVVKKAKKEGKAAEKAEKKAKKSPRGKDETETKGEKAEKAAKSDKKKDGKKATKKDKR
jgi:Calcium-activated BK potassium channel alpha subunit/Calcium-activated potassium channel slowpoke-like RCK domain/Ion channel